MSAAAKRGLRINRRLRRNWRLMPDRRLADATSMHLRVGWRTALSAVILRESGGSSTPRLLGSITGVSGILDHPHARVMTTEYDFAYSRRIAPEVCKYLSRPPLIRGRR